MARIFNEEQLVIATHNDGKLAEIANILGDYVTDIRSAAQLGLPEPDETGRNFIENAELKARQAAQKSAIPALADDSGLVVPALGGAPGIYSARWAGKPRNFDLAMQRVWAELQTVQANDYRAYFTCALSLAWPDGHSETVEGYVYGQLVWPGRGNQGFGYDPIFLPDGETQTFGEMEPSKKHAMSHRAKAFEQLRKLCFQPER